MKRSGVGDIQSGKGRTARPEARLLLLCARTNLTAHERDVLPTLFAAGVDWPALDAMAVRHGLSPLLHRHLLDVPGDEVPKAWKALWWARHEARTRRNHAMARELIEITKLLAAGGILAVPYKGPTLAIAAYGDLSLREFGDLDLLVRPDDALRAKALLAARGYIPEYALIPPLDEALVHSRRHYELPLRNSNDGFLIELHWRTDPQFSVARLEDPAWRSGLDRIELNGATVPMLKTDELLLILCLHGTKHSWASLGWLVDVVELAGARPGIDWDRIVAQASELGAGRHLALGLHLADHWLDMPLPASVRAFVGAQRVKHLASRIGSEFFEHDGSAPSAARFIYTQIALQASWRARVGYLLHMAFTPGLGEWQRWSLPRPLFALYWLLRPIRLFEKYVLRRTPPAAKPRTPPPQPHSKD